MKIDPIKTRFAPSPTGRLHLGNLRTALFNALYARARSGVFLLRSEDTDAERSRDEFLDAIMQDLRWLGLQWQEGPEAGGEAGPYRQSARDAVYAEYYERLLAADQAYPCFCTETELHLERRQALQARRPPRYSGRCAGLDAGESRRRIDAGTACTLRFRVPDKRSVEFDDLVRGPQTMQSDEIGDFVIRRSDGSPAFFFSNAIDDALMGVSHVLRGEDHLTNTPRQLLLLEALGLGAPRYGHISMIVDEDGGPLSKRSGSAGLAELREFGYLPVAILNHLARLGHHSSSDDLLDLDGLGAIFDTDQLGRAPARHDPQQLRHWQKLAMARLADAELMTLLSTWRGPGDESIASLVPAPRWTEFVGVIHENIVLPGDAWEIARDWFADGPPRDPAVIAEIETAGGEFFDHALGAYSGAEQTFADFARCVRELSGRSGKRLFMPLRAALTYALHGPEMGRVLSLLEPQRVQQRLRQARDLASA